MKRLMISLALIASAPMFALLPPVWQGVAEIRAILNDPQLNSELNSGDILESITREENGWLITTSKSKVRVQVIPQPQNMPGPEKFKLKYEKLQ